MSFYAVRVGLNPGIYSNWDDCQKQVKGFSNAKFKKFNTYSDAIKFIIETDSIEENQSKVDTQKRDNESSKVDEEPSRKKKRIETVEPVENFNKKSNELDNQDCKKTSFSFNNQDVIVFTDGACSNNGKADALAGIGVYFGPNHQLNVSRKLTGLQTNNRAEITAAIVAIELAILHKAGSLTIKTDSKFMINCIENWIKTWKKNGWKTSKNEEVKNIEDLKKLDLLCSKIKVNWQYVPGHQGVHGNEEADRLARDAVYIS